MDFIAEYVWVFIIIGVVIILVAIGYIVDKFVINKHQLSNPKKDELVPAQGVSTNMMPNNEMSNNGPGPFEANASVPIEMNQASVEPVKAEDASSDLDADESVVVTESLFDTQNVNNESVNIDTEKNEDSV